MEQKYLETWRTKTGYMVLVCGTVILLLSANFPVWTAWREYRACPQYYRLHIGYLLELSYTGSAGDRMKAEKILEKAKEAFTAENLTAWEAYERFGVLEKYTPAEGREGDREDFTGLKLLAASLDGGGNGYLWVRICDAEDRLSGGWGSIVRWKVADGKVEAVSQAP